MRQIASVKSVRMYWRENLNTGHIKRQSKQKIQNRNPKTERVIDDVGRKHRWKQSNTGDCKEDGADSHKAGKGAKAGSKFYTRDRKSNL